MSGDFRKFPEILALMEWFAIQPGDYATCDHRDDAEVRARNHACTPTEVWHFPPEFAGLAGGETGV